jgi:hypothetical protein
MTLPPHHANHADHAGHAAHAADASHDAHGAPPSRFDAAACAADAPATERQREQIEHSLVSTLGAAADGLVHALRDARTVRDLLDVITTAQSAIAMARGRDAAAEFASRYRGLADE